MVAESFALCVLLCDGYLTLKVEDGSEFILNPNLIRLARFFHLAQALPLELQMVLCNRVRGSGRLFVLTWQTEAALQALVKHYNCPKPFWH